MGCFFNKNNKLQYHKETPTQPLQGVSRLFCTLNLNLASRLVHLLGIAGLSTGSALCTAGVGNIGNTFGLSPQDLASAQSRSLFNISPTATYYNPALLALGEHSELMLGYLHSDPSLEIRSRGGSGVIERSGGSVAESDNNEVVLLGVRLDLGGAFSEESNAGIGLLLGLDDKGNSLLKVYDRTSESGQFLQYGIKPMFFALAGAGKITDQLSIGLGVNISIATFAPVELESTLSGDTSNENIRVSADTRYSPLFGLHFDGSSLECGDCASSNLQVAFSFRGEHDYDLDLDANAVIPGTVNDPGLDLIVRFLNAFQPDIVSLGAQYAFGQHWKIHGSIENQMWSSLEDAIKEKKRNAVKDQAAARFSDTVVPRIGVTYQTHNLLFFDALDVMAGYSYEKSALQDGLTPDANLLDNDRHILACGFSGEIATGLLREPLQIAGAYQQHRLTSRDFELSRQTDTGVERYERVNTSGDINVLQLSLTVRF